MDYYGEFPELYAATIYSVPELQGYFFDGSRGPFDSIILVMDVDDYGRVLFLYNEGTGSVSGTILGIVQYWDDSYVYFYPAELGNFIAAQIHKEVPRGLNLRSDMDLLIAFFEDDIKDLKINNDWNMEMNTEMNTDKIVRAEISRGNRWSSR